MATNTELGTTTWTELRQRPPVLVAVPLGSSEQHGPHLPLDTDTRVATALAQALAAARPDVLVSPPVAIGASGEHGGFPGTLSIGTAVLTQVLVELCRSADWAAGVVVVNGHGGNLSALSEAQAAATREGRSMLAWSPTAPEHADAHAGWLETSLVLALAPHLVRAERPRGRTEPLGELWPELRRGGVAAISPSGVLGDATSADAEDGRRVLDAWTADLIACVERRWPRPAP